LYFWAHPGELIEDPINDLSYLTGTAQRTLREYWDGIRRKGSLREVNGKVERREV
jgi:hypothetical protein